MKTKMTTMMKSIAVLLVALGCCTCEPQADCGGNSSSSCAFCSVTQTIEALIMEKMKVLETRVEKNEKNVETRLEKNEKDVTRLEENEKHLETRLEKSEKDVKELRGLIGGQPRVAFSAALMTSGAGLIGQFTVDTTLKYQRVFSNTGSCYNPSTGVFTAQAKGMYYFRFSAFNNSVLPRGVRSIVSLMKNGEQLVSVWDEKSSDPHDMGSNAAVIALESGDKVSVKLRAHTAVYDDGMNYNSFSGFLLFTM